MGGAPGIMQEMEVALVEVAVEKLMMENTKNEVAARCRSVRDALVIFDALFAIVFKDNEMVDMQADLPALEGLVQMALEAWTNLKDTNRRDGKNIPPKVHAIVQHLVDQFIEYGGAWGFQRTVC